ncbi:class E sortase [Aquipuribacter nitratireducens]|uniref:Class E sortase n=1 Tax=Aquipuribacter nitratireducens TaxID=650104 RepID=A0ABW0GNU3_9MICO
MTAGRLLVRTTGELVMTLGVLLLLFLAWQLWWTDVEADRAQARTTAALEEQWDALASGQDGAAPARPEPAAEPDPVAADPVLAALPSEAVALLRVPAFGDDYVRPVVAGTGELELQQGIGHYDGTAGPGEVGNFAIAGHRTTYGAPFNPIAELRTGDPVVVETATEFHVYRVQASRIVLPTDVEVIAPVPDRPGEEPTEAWLTMTSCHPMFSARERYVVHALLESSTPRADGRPDVLAAASAATGGGA